MKYEDALHFIHSPKYNGMKLGLENIRELMKSLGDPQKKLKVIHIAGTNGKGSVASYLSHILTEAGYQTGLFTSPYIERFNERIKVNNEDISDESLGEVTGIVKEKIKETNRNPTEFVVMTAIGLQYFKQKECDIVILEVGLGGRLDSTNVIENPILSIITPISYDHQAFLGTTLTEIAGEKAGIVKENSRVLLYPQEEEAAKVIKEIAREKNSDIFEPDFSTIREVSVDLNGQIFDYKLLRDLQITLLGEHQLKNASLVIEAINLLKDSGFIIDEKAMRDGLAATTWPGRFEMINHDPVVVIDGAHNIDSIHALVDNLTKYFSTKRIIAIIGILKDKDVEQIIENALPVIDTFITVTPENPRAMQAEDLSALLQMKGVQAISSSTYEEAVRIALEEARDEDVICAFGSLYYIGAIRKIFASE